MLPWLLDGALRDVVVTVLGLVGGAPPEGSGGRVSSSTASQPDLSRVLRRILRGPSPPQGLVAEALLLVSYTASLAARPSAVSSHLLGATAVHAHKALDTASVQPRSASIDRFWKLRASCVALLERLTGHRSGRRGA